jgi:WD40 repeat protein
VAKFMSLRNWKKNTSRLWANSLFRRMSEGVLLFTFVSASAVFANQQPGVTPDSPKPELVLQTGPNGPAQGVAFSNDGRLLASGGYGGLAINVWETATGRQLRLLSKHAGNTAALFAGVTSIALSRDAQFLAGGFADNSVTIWDLNSGEELASMQGSGTIHRVANCRNAGFACKPKCLAVASHAMKKETSCIRGARQTRWIGTVRKMRRLTSSQKSGRGAQRRFERKAGSDECV